MADWHIKAAVFFVAGYFATANLGQIEGHFFPVVTEVSLNTFNETEYLSTEISGSFVLGRPSCDFKGLEWSLVGASREIAAPVVFLGGAKDRGGGLNEFGPWRVQLTEKQIKSQSRAVVIHKCPWRWWRTETVFYS